MVSSTKTDVLLDLQKGSAAREQNLTEYGFHILENYLESKIARGQTASQARVKLEELEQSVRDAGLTDFGASFRQVRQMLTTAENGPLWQEVSPYHYRSRRSSSVASSRSRALSAAMPLAEDANGQQGRSRDPSEVRIAETQSTVLSALLQAGADDEACYRIVHTYAKRKLIAGKDAYWTGFKLEYVEREVKSDDQYVDVGPIFVAVRRDLNLPPSTIFRPAAMARIFVMPLPTPAYDVPPTIPPPVPDAPFEADADVPPPYYPRTAATVEADTARAVEASRDEAGQPAYPLLSPA